MQNAPPTDIADILKRESGRILATLVRVLGDIDKAEEALQEACLVAMQKWPESGIPQNPYAWLVSAGKFKMIDLIRRQGRGKALLEQNLEQQAVGSIEQNLLDPQIIEDDQLRLIFYCCHPDLNRDARIALSLREVCGMSTSEIARAYFLPVETVKKRITRAKAQIKNNNIAYEIPGKDEMSERLQSVLAVIYLVFNEGYSATAGDQHIRRALTEEAVFLGRQVVKLLATPECFGLLALLLLQESRREARVDSNGDIIDLEQQDRSLWDRTLIREGLQLLETAVSSGRLGVYTLQAALASVHASADSIKNTRWDLIVQYYDMLLAINPSPVIEFHRAIAVGMRSGPQAGLALLEQLETDVKLANYHSLFAAKAEFYQQLGWRDQAIQAYQAALQWVRQEPERKYLQKQLKKIF